MRKFCLAFYFSLSAMLLVFLTSQAPSTAQVGYGYYRPSFEFEDPTPTPTPDPNWAIITSPSIPDSREPPTLPPKELQRLTGGPTTVTLRGTDTNQAIQALLSAARLPVPPSISNNDVYKRAFPVHWEKVPFWDALEQLKFAGVVELPQVIISEPTKAKLMVQTPYYRMLGVASNQEIELKAPKDTVPSPMVRTSYFEPAFNWNIYLDPRVPVSLATIRDFQAWDEEGTLLCGPVNFRLPPYGGWLLTARPKRIKVGGQRYIFPENTRTISRMTGRVHFHVDMGTKTWKIPDVLASANKSITLGDAKYAITKVAIEPNPRKFEKVKTLLRLVIQRSPRNGYLAPELDADSSRGGLHLRNDKGRKLGLRQSRSDVMVLPDQRQIMVFNLLMNSGDDETEFTPEHPISLEWELPTTTRTMDVPFELANIRIPSVSSAGQ